MIVYFTQTTSMAYEVQKNPENILKCTKEGRVQKFR